MAFSKVPNTFFGPGYTYREFSILVRSDSALDLFNVQGDYGPFGMIADGDPVYLKLAEYTWNLTSISENLVYYIRDLVNTPNLGVAPTGNTLTFKLAATQGGAAITFTGTTTFAFLNLLPRVSFIADTSHLSPAVTGASGVENLTSLTSANAHETTGDYRYIVNEIYKALKARNDAVTPADRSTVLRIESEEYQQGVANVITRAYRSEVDLTYATSAILAES